MRGQGELNSFKISTEATRVWMMRFAKETTVTWLMFPCHVPYLLLLEPTVRVWSMRHNLKLVFYLREEDQLERKKETKHRIRMV